MYKVGTNLESPLKDVWLQAIESTGLSDERLLKLCISIGIEHLKAFSNNQPIVKYSSDGILSKEFKLRGTLIKPFDPPDSIDPSLSLE